MLYKCKVLLFSYYIPNYLFLTPTQPGEGMVNLALTGHLSEVWKNHRPPETKQERKVVTGSSIHFIIFHHCLPRSSPMVIPRVPKISLSLDDRSTQNTWVGGGGKGYPSDPVYPLIRRPKVIPPVSPREL